MKKLLGTTLTLSMLLMLSACAKDNIKVEETYAVELGDQISTDAKTYLAKDTDKEVLKDTVITFKEDKAYSVDKKSKSLKPTKEKYLPVGKYEATATYKDEKEKFVVEVKDTKAPTFVDFKKEIVIEANAEDVDITKYFKAEDLSKLTISIDKAQLDLTKAGTYGITVTASDAYKNAKVEKVAVKVVDLETAEKNGVTAMIDGTKPQSKALKEKLAKAEEEKKAAEEAKKEEEKSQQQQAQNNYKPPVTVNQPTTDTGNTDTQKPTNPTPPTQKPQEPTTCVLPKPGEDGKVYASKQEAWDAGWLAIDTEGSPFFDMGYNVIGTYDSCYNIYYVLTFYTPIQ